ncbi:MAG: DUF1501 domain-containing protein [Pirellulales bacterium]
MKSHFSHLSCCGQFGKLPITRREMLRHTGLGFGALALAGLVADDRPASASVPLSVRHEATAKSVIFLFMGGGPSHVDTFDPKPDLTRLDGQETPESIQRLFQRTASMGNGTRTLMASPFTFSQYGQSGHPVSSLLPAIAEQVDELCIIRSMQHDTAVHMPGEYIMTTGTTIGDRPSLGAWVSYGLGSENSNLPGYVVFGTPKRPTYASGFLPSRYQGTRIQGTSISHLANPTGITQSGRRRQIDFVTYLNQLHSRRTAAESELDARIRSYELAFQMQANAPEAFDLTTETVATNRLYGIDHKKSVEVGTQCLLARRLVQRGVRFIQIYVPGWDSHADLRGGHLSCAQRSDRPVAGLLADLKQRGMLDSTLVIWGGEFGRTPGAEKNNGRDHSPGGFTIWLAGGGVRGGQIIGATDPVGYTAIERPIHPNSLHATILHALGVDQEELNFSHNGRNEIPTFVPSEVVHEVFV